MLWVSAVFWCVGESLTRLSAGSEPVRRRRRSAPEGGGRSQAGLASSPAVCLDDFVSFLLKDFILFERRGGGGQSAAPISHDPEILT